jgi:hypothetical protein
MRRFTASSALMFSDGTSDLPPKMTFANAVTVSGMRSAHDNAILAQTAIALFVAVSPAHECCQSAHWR